MWGREGSVETLAFTGVAAINVKGRTIHSARNLKLNGAQNNPTPTVEMKSRFTRVVLVIIDEISMTDQALLGGTDLASRSLAGNTNKIMGGRHIMLIGDWLQLPSVAGSPCTCAWS
jgi:ATP-dependent DNA helicase PIF1